MCDVQAFSIEGHLLKMHSWKKCIFSRCPEVKAGRFRRNEWRRACLLALPEIDANGNGLPPSTLMPAGAHGGKNTLLKPAHRRFPYGRYHAPLLCHIGRPSALQPLAHSVVFAVDFLP